jgi:hypothetical protein
MEYLFSPTTTVKKTSTRSVNTAGIRLISADRLFLYCICIPYGVRGRPRALLRDSMSFVNPLLGQQNVYAGKTPATHDQEAL